MFYMSILSQFEVVDQVDVWIYLDLIKFYGQCFNAYKYVNVV